MSEHHIPIHEITDAESAYPENLLKSDFRPPALRVRGEIVLQDMQSVAIVGSRDASSYGKEMTEFFATELAKAGITIISGMARGIDSIAHRAAIAAGGRTIAVLGSGLDVIYPPEHKELYNEIIKYGAVVSEFPDDTPPFKQNFLQRNLTIIGLSKAVLVIEGTEKSGTLFTGNRAAEMGKEVFALPHLTESPSSFVPHRLLNNGATPAESPQTIISFVESIL